MNTWWFYRRIRGPVFLLTFGVTALLWEWDVLSFWQSWPLYLIVAGFLRLAEGAAFARTGSVGAVYPGMAQGAVAGWPAGTDPTTANAAVPGTGLAIIAPAPIQPVESAAGYTPEREEER